MIKYTLKADIHVQQADPKIAEKDETNSNFSVTFGILFLLAI